LRARPSSTECNDMKIEINFTEGLPQFGLGAYIFLLWDGSLCEGELIRRDDDLFLVRYIGDGEGGGPRRIEKRADQGLIQAHTQIASRGRKFVVPYDKTANVER